MDFSADEERLCPFGRCGLKLDCTQIKRSSLQRQLLRGTMTIYRDEIYQGLYPAAVAKLFD